MYRYRRQYGSVEQYPEILLLIGVVAVVVLAWWLAHARLFFTHAQLAEILVLVVLLAAWVAGTVGMAVRRRNQRLHASPQAPLVVAPSKTARDRGRAYAREGIVLGYDSRRRPWVWTDQIRTMQSILFGTSGSGKSTLLKSIIIQDIYRKNRAGQSLPMVILDGKGDMEFFYSLLPHIHRAGRLHQLRLINPDLPEWSSAYNPFHATDGDYLAHVDMVFGSFNLHDEFFSKHQLNYLGDIVRILWYTKKRFNFYDTLVMALDETVMQEQMVRAMKATEEDGAITAQRRKNLRMSISNLMQSLSDRERVPKIQGLLNELTTFLDDKMSLITLPYEDLLSFEEVIDNRLILFVSLNANKNTDAVSALGKMLLQNLQLTVGKRYADPQAVTGDPNPFFSCIFDEFAPFGYKNFPKILNTARGANTALLFSLQSMPQLLGISRSFMEDVSSAPNTTLCMRTRDRETCDYILKASSQQQVERRSLAVQRRSLFNPDQYRTTGQGSVTEVREYRIRDEQIKYLPKGQMHVLQSDDTVGMRMGLLHVHPIVTPVLPGYEPILYRRPIASRKESEGICLEFSDPKILSRAKATARATKRQKA